MAPHIVPGLQANMAHDGLEQRDHGTGRSCENQSSDSSHVADEAAASLRADAASHFGV